MGLFLSRFALLMGGTTAGDGGGGTPGVGVQFDAAKASAGHTLSNDDRTLINASGGSDYRRWVPATTNIPGKYPVPVYWEFEANPAGPAEFNGYHGVVSQRQLDDPATTYDSGENPIQKGSICYRGNGQIWGNDADNLTGYGSVEAYGAGDVIMLGFDPQTGEFWFGANGVWEDDPATSRGTYKSIDARTEDFRPVGQGREPDEGGTLRSLTSQFSYSVPSGFAALGQSIGIEDGVAAHGLDTWMEIGGGQALGAAVHELWIEKDTS